MVVGCHLLDFASSPTQLYTCSSIHPNVVRHYTPLKRSVDSSLITVSVSIVGLITSPQTQFSHFSKPSRVLRLQLLPAELIRVNYLTGEVEHHRRLLQAEKENKSHGSGLHEKNVILLSRHEIPATNMRGLSKHI